MGVLGLRLNPRFINFFDIAKYSLPLIFSEFSGPFIFTRHTLNQIK